MNSKNERLTRHLLVVVDTDGKRTYVLEASMYSIGRDETNAIVLKSENVSRQHAILLRTPLLDHKGYRYRIQDGNLQGKRSINGISVNGHPQVACDLNHGDLIVFGGSMQAAYYIKELSEQELAFQVKHPEFRSLKAEVTNQEQTIEMPGWREDS